MLFKRVNWKYQAIILSLILILICVVLLVHFPPTQTHQKSDPAWANAEEQFAAYIAPEIKRFRKKLNDPKIRFTHVKNEVLSKYLPEHRLYVVNSIGISAERTYFIDQAGNIFNLGSRG